MTRLPEHGPFLLEQIPSSLIVHEAPFHTQMSLTELAYGLESGGVSVYGDTVAVGSPDRFLYQVVGWEDSKLVLQMIPYVAKS